MSIASASFYIEDTMLINYGVPASTIQRSCARNQKRLGTGSWRHYKRGSQLLIDYDSIPASTIKRYGIPSKERLIALQKESLHQAITLQKMLASKSIPELIKPNPKVRQYYLEELAGKETNLFNKLVADYTRVAAWLTWISEVRSAKSVAELGNFNSMHDFYKHVLELINKEQLHNFKVKNIRTFQRKFKPFRNWEKQTQGQQNKALNSLISRKIGSSNASKMTDWHQHQLIKLARVGLQLDHTQLWADLNNEARKQQLVTVSLSTVKAWLTDPQFKIRIERDRIGKLAATSKNSMIITRDKASVPDALWWIDGTPEELWYWDNEVKKLKRLEVIKVVDDHSDCIVGYAIGETENTDLVYRAVKNAVEFRGTCAKQITSDKGSALQSHVMKAWFKVLFKNVTPSKAGHPRSKRIEPFQGHFRKQILSRNANHSFGNITSKGPQANKDYIKAHYKEFPQTKQELTVQIETMINAWNHRANSKGQVPLELYDRQYEDRTIINELMHTDLFYLWRKRPVNYGAEGLVMSYNKQRLEYLAPCPVTHESPKEELEKVAVFMNENIGRKFEVKFDPDNLDRIALYYNNHFYAYAYRKAHTHRALYDTTPETGALLKQYQLIQRLQDDDIDRFYQRNDEFVDANGLMKQTMTIAAVTKEQNNKAGSKLKEVEVEGRKIELEITKPLPKVDRWAT